MRTVRSCMSPDIEVSGTDTQALPRRRIAAGDSQTGGDDAPTGHPNNFGISKAQRCTLLKLRNPIYRDRSFCECPARAASTTLRHCHPAATGGACSSDPRLSHGTPATRLFPEMPGRVRPPLAWQQASPIFWEKSISPERHRLAAA